MLGRPRLLGLSSLPWSRRGRGAGGSSPGFDGGLLSAPSVYDALEVIATAADTTVRTETDSLVAGGDDHGPYTWARATGPLVLDSEAAWDALLGVGHDDLRPALVYVEGDVTVSHDPARRRPFVALECTGTLDLDEDINGLGANHSASGSDKPSTRIIWRLGTFGGVTDPQVPDVGGAGGAGAPKPPTGTGRNGAPGAAGVGGGLGGGGEGGLVSGNDSTGSLPGAGADASSYSGGAGGGAIDHDGAVRFGEGGAERGGAGGAGFKTDDFRGAGGGAGNPGGAPTPEPNGVTTTAGESRTGGVWYVVAGSIAGPGSIVCDGADGGSGRAGGGASGGGHVTAQADDSSAWSGAVTANGGVGGSGTLRNGGNGGLGWAAVLPLTEDAP